MFTVSLKDGILSENLKRSGYTMKRKTSAPVTDNCTYCSGKGYFQLLLGGSETCPCCSGTGKKN